MTDDAVRCVGVVGLGRLGRAVVQAGRDQGLRMVTIGRWGEWPLGARGPSVVVDASSPSAQPALLDYCKRQGSALVECVSSLDAGQWEALRALADEVPVIRATNLSMGHHLQGEAVRLIGKLLGAAQQVLPEAAVWERHPAMKAHRPSASALHLADIWRETTGHETESIDSQRAGMPVSDHEVLLTWQAESLTVRHSVGSLAAAASGALAAVRWADGRAPGLTDIRTVFDEIIGRV